MARPARGAPLGTPAAALALLILLFSRARASELSPPLVAPELGPIVRMQVKRAATRLATPGCALVLGDFSDGRTGRPLRESLEASGLSAPAYLSTLVFRPGPAGGPCADPRIAAYTMPGSRVVYVCRDQFLRWHKSREGFGTTVLIHETLHSLGLGENPPTSAEINARVDARCAW